MAKKIITFIPGDGIGPEIIDEVIRVLESAGAEIKWDVQCAGEESERLYDSDVNDELLKSIAVNKVALKGPIGTQKGSGHRSTNVFLREHFATYAGVRPVMSFSGLSGNVVHSDVDLVVIRENLGGLYSGIEFARGERETAWFRLDVKRWTGREIPNDSAIAVRPISFKQTKDIVHFAFRYAKDNERKRVTVVHKANILKVTDGLFLDTAREVALEYPEIDLDDMIVDNCAMQLAKNPGQFDVLVCPNLYGDIISDLSLGLIGGLGLGGGANIGKKVAIFEAVHGTAPDISGQNRANPIAMLLSACMLLRYIGQREVGDTIEKAVREVVKEGKHLTADIAKARTRPVGTKEFANAVIEKLK